MARPAPCPATRRRVARVAADAAARASRAPGVPLALLGAARRVRAGGRQRAGSAGAAL
jgi:hypothetical protein